MRLHVFNPQHDLALSDGKPWYIPPRSALKFAQDCALLPLWYTHNGDAVLAAEDNKRWLDGIYEIFPQLNGISVTPIVNNTHTIVPWGHDYEVYYKLGIEPVVDIKLIERLSDRIQTLNVANWLSQHCLGIELPEPPTVIASLEQLQKFLNTHTEWVIKMPLSGSGQGVIKGHGNTDTGLTNRILSEIKRHGHVMAEPYHNKVMDFAMEFFLQANGLCSFKGYSLFTTSDKGIYAGNLLASDAYIESKLTEEIPLTTLNAVNCELTDFFSSKFAGYTGPIGVDMIIYKEDGVSKINPFIEINLRQTMGMVARHFFDNFVDSQSQGWLKVVRLTRKLPPPAVSNGKLVSGRLYLTPVTDNTEIALLAEVTPLSH